MYIGSKKQHSFPRSAVPVSGSRMRLMVQPNRRYFLFCINGYSKDEKKKWSLLRDETKTANGFTERVFRMQLRVSQPDQRLTEFVCSPCLTLLRRRRRVASLMVRRSSLLNFGHISKQSHTVNTLTGWWLKLWFRPGRTTARVAF